MHKRTVTTWVTKEGYQARMHKNQLQVEGIEKHKAWYLEFTEGFAKKHNLDDKWVKQQMDSQFGPFLCGYVGVPKTHPLYGKSYGKVSRNINIHGGLTFSNFWEQDKEYWFFGFDCHHLDDTYDTCNEEYVRKEIDKLSKQLAKKYSLR